jgi:hypothetical protein
MTDNKYIASYYESNIPDFFEKVLPEINENRKEQQTNICNRLREVITFDTENKFFAIKFNTIMPFIQNNIECNNITFVEEDSEKNTGFLKFKENLMTLPFYYGISKPLLTDTFIQFEHDRFYPKLNSEGELIGFEGHFAQKWNKYPEKVLVDDVEKIIIKDNEIIVNGESFSFDNYTITPIYNEGFLEGFVIGKYCIHFPEVNIDFSQNLTMTMFNEVPLTIIKPTKISFSLIKIEMIKQEEISKFYLPKSPEYPKIIDEAFWKKYCINFPESSFESYHKYLDSKQKRIKQYQENIEKYGPEIAILTKLMENIFDKKVKSEIHSEEDI